MQTYQTNFIYKNREEKAKYVYLKYKSIITGKILDVGADECYLKKHFNSSVEYTGIGLGGNPDIKIDLEKEKIPALDNTYDLVICLDVLEHLDNIHETFLELCRVSKRYVLISLPNCWASFISMMQKGKYSADQSLKFYGLPLEKPDDRHKWFFSSKEAEEFIKFNSIKNEMKIVQIDVEGRQNINKNLNYIFRNAFKYFFWARYLPFASRNFQEFVEGNVWALLEKNV